MKVIECLAEKIEEELHDAQEYIELAAKWKTEQPNVADLFCELSSEEMGHVDKLHQMVQELIAEYRSKRGEPPKEMMVLYDYLHEKHIAKATEIKVKQGMYQM